MNCFHHQSRVAVAVCKSCGKALCSECAAEVPNGVACRNACEERVRWLNDMLDQSTRVRAVANSQIRSAGFMLLFIGLFLLGMAAWQLPANEAAAYYFGGIGLFFVAFGVWRLIAATYPALKLPPRDED